MPSYYTGQTVNGYEIIDCVTSGAFATSYRARKGGKTFFLKEYCDPTQASPDFSNFVKQQDAINSRLCSLTLGCLERLLDTFVTGYRYHQVKELLNCVDLKTYLETDFDLDNRMFICRLWLGILRELSAAGIVHQDLKPAQILMVKKPGIKLNHFMIFADFDWAIIDGVKVRSVSTPGYAAPEHLTGVTPTIASDLYQSGVVLYELLTGRLPFYNAGEFYEVDVAAGRMERSEFEQASVVQPVVPTWASAIISAMLTWNPATRPTVEAVITAWDRKAPLAVVSPKPKTTSTPSKTSLGATSALAPATPSPAKVASWIRLRHDSGANMSFSSDVMQVTRPIFNGPFRTVLTDAGHPVAAYFPSDDVTPLFTVRRETDCWQITGSSHRNRGILNGADLDPVAWQSIKHGDSLEIFSRNDAAVVARFNFEVPA